MFCVTLAVYVQALLLCYMDKFSFYIRGVPEVLERFQEAMSQEPL
jgi:hypothetical protein